jgi:hypothetical protein
LIKNSVKEQCNHKCFVLCRIQTFAYKPLFFYRIGVAGLGGVDSELMRIIVKEQYMNLKERKRKRARAARLRAELARMLYAEARGGRLPALRALAEARLKQ